jgi:hypothetical protein
VNNFKELMIKNKDMKKQITEIAKDELKALQEKKLTRKEAIKKSGYMALSAATMMMLIPNGAQAASAPAAVNNTNRTPEKPAGIWED